MSSDKGEPDEISMERDMLRQMSLHAQGMAVCLLNLSRVSVELSGHLKELNRLMRQRASNLEHGNE